MTQYWVIRGGERRGPYEESDVLEGVELGTVRPNDLLWVEGMREGLPITEVIANLGAAPASKPPLTLEPLAPGAPSPYRPPAARVDDLAELALGNITLRRVLGAVRRGDARRPGDPARRGRDRARRSALAAGCRSDFRRGRRSGDLWPNVLGFALARCYFAALESGPRCATYGKRAFHLQVLGADDLTRIRFLRASARWIGRFVSTFLLMIGYLMQPFTPRKRALHDYIAGTVVVVQARYSRALVGDRDRARARRAGDPRRVRRRRHRALGVLPLTAAGRGQSTFAPEAFTTFAHFSMSWARNFPNSSGAHLHRHRALLGEVRLRRRAARAPSGSRRSAGRRSASACRPAP